MWKISYVLLSSLVEFIISAVLLCTLIVAGTYAVFYMIDRRRYVINGKLPGYKKWPIVGDILHMDRDPLKFQKQVDDLAAKNIKQGVFYIRVFLRDAVILTNYNEIEKLLGSSTLIDKGMEYQFISPWLGVSLLTGGGQLWRYRRKLLTPSFHFNILRDFLPVIVENSVGLRDELAKHADTGEALDITKYVTLTSLDIINETAMGTKIDALHNGDSNYVKAVKKMKDLVVRRAINPRLWREFMFNLSSVGREHNRLMKVLHDYTKSVIVSRRSQLCNQGTGTKYKAFLDTLLVCRNQDGTPLTDDEIRAEVDTFMFEGHDTTSAAIERCLYLLGENISEQRKCQQELDDLFDGGRLFTWNDLSKLPYLECCIKEAMRIYPIVPSYSRILNEDTNFGGYIVAKGTTVMVRSDIIHKNPDVYKDPKIFDPTRFIPENSSKRHPYAYIPFSAGPRNCIGQKLAMMEMKVVVSTLLRCFNIKSVQKRDDVLDSPSVVLDSVSGIWLKLSSRV